MYRTLIQIIIYTLANKIEYCAYNRVNWITIWGIFEKILPCIHNFDVHPKAKPSTFKNKSKNLQHSNEIKKTFNIKKQEQKPSISLRVRTLQPL
jgi:hypothetical protein